jgi:hypothetical protein
LHRCVGEYIVAEVGGRVVVIDGHPLGACVANWASCRGVGNSSGRVLVRRSRVWRDEGAGYECRLVRGVEG